MHAAIRDVLAVVPVFQIDFKGFAPGVVKQHDTVDPTAVIWNHMQQTAAFFQCIRRHVDIEQLALAI